MEAVAVGRSVGLVTQQTRPLSGLTAGRANSSTNLRALPAGDISRKQRLLCRALPVESQNDVNLANRAAVTDALQALEEDVQEQGTDKPEPKVRVPPSDKVTRPGLLEGTVGLISKTVANAVFSLLQYAQVEDENPYTLENFAPVEEIGDKVPVEILSGAIPPNFPAGTYVRAGPNPIYGGKYMKSLLGSTTFHWFEGDGMLHAVYFEKRGDEYQLFYKNKYVETSGYLADRQEGKPIVLAVMEGQPSWALVLNSVLNQIRFGFDSKPTCNTSVWSHSGRVFAGSENNLPYEINISDLSTVGVFDCNGAWRLPNFTAHSKIDPRTNDLICQGFSVDKKPHTLVGVISADGETLVHEIDVGSERPGLNHDIAITERYTVVLDFPLVVDPLQILKGKSAIVYKHDTYSKIAIIPRFGDANSVRWFDVETNFMFHIFNAYDHGNEVVVQGLRSRASFLNTQPGLEKEEWYRRGITRAVPGQEGYDPLNDGSLMTYLHEWRFDLEAGTVTERDLVDEVENYQMMEMPRINESYIGRKYRYGYAICIDNDRSCNAGVPYYGKIGKVDFSSTEDGKGLAKTELHDLGPNRYGSEAVFVAKPGSTEEDDGWLLTYVYDESTGQSEAIIIDAKKFTEEPVARILLPQRVPFGFHGTFVPAL